MLSRGKYVGVAPWAYVVAVKVLDEAGRGSAGDALAGIQWIIDNHRRYNIRVANLSIGAADVGRVDPLVRAVEAAWDAGIVVVVAAGNNGPSAQSITSPGTSRKVITVGAADDGDLTEIGGSAVRNFSGRGPTLECIVKPDIVAMGCGVVSALSNSPELTAARRKGIAVVDRFYARMSGTSMASPKVAGAVAALLTKYPNLKPDEVKLRLKLSATDLRLSPNKQGWGELDIKKFLEIIAF